MSSLFPPPQEEVQESSRPARPRRQGLGRIVAPILAIGAVLLKLAGSLKFLGRFLAAGGHALVWEAGGEGLNPQLPVFIPFLGAYVALRDVPFDPWRNALVSAAGPFAGGIAAL